MKRKLVLGLGLVACVFILAGIMIAASLSKLRLVADLKDRQQKIVTSYDRMLYLVNDDQTNLYAFEAGYERDLSLIRNNVRETKSLLSSIRDGYDAYSTGTTCMHCHFRMKTAGSVEILADLGHHKKTLNSIYDRIVGYDEMILRIAQLGGVQSARPLVKAAARDSEEIEDLILNVRNAMDKMNESLDKLALTEVQALNVCGCACSRREYSNFRHHSHTDDTVNNRTNEHAGPWHRKGIFRGLQLQGEHPFR